MTTCTISALHLACTPRHDDPLAVGFGLMLLIVVGILMLMENR
jgi:hypothetical protein